MPVDHFRHLLVRLQALCTVKERTLQAKEGLQAVHAAILNYLACANRYSDTPIAVSDYLGLTKGTVSQSILWLRKQQWLDIRADAKDRRKRHLLLTAKARTYLAQHSNQNVFDKVHHQQPNLVANATTALQELLTAIQRFDESGFGICSQCRHLQQLQIAQAPEAFRCGLTGEALASIETKLICREQSPSIK